MVPFASRDEPFGHAVPGCGIEAVERLVEQENGRAGRNRRRKRQPSSSFIGERLDRRIPVQADEIRRDAGRCGRLMARAGDKSQILVDTKAIRQNRVGPAYAISRRTR